MKYAPRSHKSRVVKTQCCNGLIAQLAWLGLRLSRLTSTDVRVLYSYNYLKLYGKLVMNKYKKKYRSVLFLDPPHRWLPPRAFISRMLFLQWIAPSRAIPSQGPKSRANPCATPCHICDREPSQIISRGARYGGSCDMARSHGVPTRDLCDLCRLIESIDSG